MNATTTVSGFTERGKVYFANRVVLLASLVLGAVTLPGRTVHSAGAIAPSKSGEVMVRTTFDEGSPVVEIVRDGGMLSPVAETTNAGVKWFLVRTKNGNMGWIKSDPGGAETKRMEDHFRGLPKDRISVDAPSSAPEAAVHPSARGKNIIPIVTRGPQVYVAVTFNNSVSSYLLLDTGAYQTVISKRIATELRLPAFARAMSRGLGGSITHDVGRLDSIRVGGYELRNFTVSILDHTSELNLEGLLGYDFLRSFHVSIDPEKQEMILTPRKK
ncbi:MAG TPA: retropepsin-like aspartic protease [Candidatus Binatia bacterium]|nr:retropepsin-like aspartic protease [Candidatus Binatia bacterium]